MDQVKIQALIVLKDLKESHIINETEFTILKDKILADNISTQNDNPQSDNEVTIKAENKNVNTYLFFWILLGVFAFIAVLLLIVIVNTTQKYDNYYGEETVAVEEVTTEEAAPAEETDYYYNY